MSQMPLSPTIKQNSSKDKKSSLLESIEKSFEENQELWSELYPGLSFSYLKSHFYEYCGNRFPENLFYNQWFGGLIELKWKRYSSLLSLGMPLAYITKTGYFFETEFYVDERVLIPRFETEVLLEHIFEELKTLDKKLPFRPIRLAEVGVGPGTLSLSIAQQRYSHPLHITGGDLSSDALKVCELNAFRLGFAIPKENSVELIKSDRMDSFSGMYDLIYSNPPYIKKKSDYEQVHSQVAKHEPEMALFIEDDEYDKWFDDLFKGVDRFLDHGGLFLMEGHESHLDNLLMRASSLLSCEGEVIVDLTGRKRVLKIRKK